MKYESARAMVYEKWSEQGSGEHMVLVTPGFHKALEEEDPDPMVNEGVRGIHYLIVAEGTLGNEDGQHAHFRVMSANEAIKEAKKSW